MWPDWVETVRIMGVMRRHSADGTSILPAQRAAEGGTIGPESIRIMWCARFSSSPCPDREEDEDNNAEEEEQVQGRPPFTTGVHPHRRGSTALRYHRRTTTSPTAATVAERAMSPAQEEPGIHHAGGAWLLRPMVGLVSRQWRPPVVVITTSQTVIASPITQSHL